MPYLLAIDQGTTNSRALIFTDSGQVVSQHEIAFRQSYPHPGWVEQDPEQMVVNSIECCRLALTKAKLSAKEIAAIGISNQRETTIIWEKKTGRPIYPAIVWQDRRTSQFCKELADQGLQKQVTDKTGLLLDPYFSATKIHWLLQHIPDARPRAERGELLFGTVDTFLLWKLTQGQVHATDATNASRTLLFNIHTQKWDDDLLKIFAIPSTLLPDVLDNTAQFGKLAPAILGEAIPIAAMVGDQQAATVGQACFKTGMMKITYGTGGFLVLNTGDKALHSKHQLLTTIAYRIAGKVTYGLEGSIFSAGTAIKWLRDKLNLIQTAAESETFAANLTTTDGVYLIPAFTGLGAPHWRPHVRAMLSGLTQNTGKEQIVRAALESVVYQTRDLIDVMQKEFAGDLTTLRVDGGMSANNWLLQFLADLLALPIARPHCTETTAQGAAYLAGLSIGVYHSLEDIAKHWQPDQIFKPQMPDELREKFYGGWQAALRLVVTA